MTFSRFQARRASSRRSTATRFVFTRIEAPYRASDGRSASFSKARTKQNVHWWAQPMYGLSDQRNDMFRTRVSAVRHGSSRYSGRMPKSTTR